MWIEGEKRREKEKKGESEDISEAGVQTLAYVQLFAMASTRPYIAQE